MNSKDSDCERTWFAQFSSFIVHDVCVHFLQWKYFIWLMFQFIVNIHEVKDVVLKLIAHNPRALNRKHHREGFLDREGLKSKVS